MHDTIQAETCTKINRGPKGLNHKLPVRCLKATRERVDRKTVFLFLLAYSLQIVFFFNYFIFSKTEMIL